MSDVAGAHGYVTDASYAETFFRELSPAWLNYVAALNGAAARPLDAPFRYLELGCGFGGSTVVNAGAFPHAEFHGCDVNPAHVAGARRHAAALDVGNVHFHETTFAALAGPQGPAFDFIVLHGVYSWVDAAARQAVRRVIAERLAPGGLVYVSYNCMPGWAVETPLRRLLVELSADACGTAEARAGEARDQLERLAGARLRYLTAHPAAAQAIASYVRQPVEYLAHEFLNDAWEPFYSIDVADDMAEAGVTYVGSATLPDNHPALVLEAGAAQAIAAIPGGRAQQLALDVAVNRRFRRDVFVRADCVLDEAAAWRQLASVPIGCLNDPRQLTTTVRVPRGELRLQDDFIADLQQVMLPGARPLGAVVGELAAGRRDLKERRQAVPVDPKERRQAVPVDPKERRQAVPVDPKERRQAVPVDSDQILRNLTYLIAAGGLTPFATPGPAASAGIAAAPLSAAPILSRLLTLIASDRVARAVPSAALGNGVLIDPPQAEALAAWLSAGCTSPPPTEASGLAETLRRLGLLT